MIQQKAVINNSGPVQAVFEDVVVGSSLQFSLYFEEEIVADSGTYTPVDFTGLTFLSEVRRSPFDAANCGTLTCTPRGNDPEDAGWVDFVLGATATAAIGQADIHWSVKVTPDDDEEGARTLLFGVIPLRYRGTR